MTLEGYLLKTTQKNPNDKKKRLQKEGRLKLIASSY